jgi:hypothetical protein
MEIKNFFTSPEFGDKIINWSKHLLIYFRQLHEIFWREDISTNLKCQFYTELTSTARAIMVHMQRRLEIESPNLLRFMECVVNITKKDFVFPQVVEIPSSRVITMISNDDVDDDQEEIDTTLSSATTASTSTSTAYAPPQPPTVTAKRRRSKVKTGSVIWPEKLPHLEGFRGPKQTSLHIVGNKENFTEEQVQVACDIVSGKIKTSLGGGGWPQGFPRVESNMTLRQTSEYILSHASDFTESQVAVAEKKLQELDAKKKSGLLKKRQCPESSAADSSITESSITDSSSTESSTADSSSTENVPGEGNESLT